MLRVWRLLKPGPKASQISDLRTAKWHDLPKEVREADDVLTGEELKLCQSVAARFNFLALDSLDLLYSVQELMRKMASQRAKDLIALKRVTPCTIKYSRMACRYLWTSLVCNIEVYAVAGCISTRKSTVGGVVLWSGQFVKAWSKTMGVLALSSGESDLAAVVRAGTEGLGSQSILRCKCCDWDGSPTRIRKSSTFGCGRLMDSASRSFGEKSGLENVGIGESESCANKVPWTRTIDAPYESV